MSYNYLKKLQIRRKDSMRKLKITLDDGQDYTLGSLNLKEQSVARKFESLSQEEEERLKNLDVDEDTDMTQEQLDELNELQDKQVENLLRIIMMSLAKFDESFKINDKAGRSEEKILDRMKGLMGIRNMRRLVSFAMMGTIPREEEEEFVINETIDLTGE